jgi:hypothetical protein
MKTALKLLFAAIFLWMTVLTIRTSLAVSLWSAWDSFASNPWAVATLYDAYFGFITFWLWVAYKENTLWSRLLWLVLILGLGNIAMSLYVLIQLFRLKPDQPAEALVLCERRGDESRAYSVLIGTASVAALMLLLWLIHLRTGNAAIVDAGWAGGLALLGVLYAALGGGYWLRSALIGRCRQSGDSGWPFTSSPHASSGIPRRAATRNCDGSGKRISRFKFLLFYEFQALLCVVLAVPFLLAARNPDPGFLRSNGPPRRSGHWRWPAKPPPMRSSTSSNPTHPIKATPARPDCGGTRGIRTISSNG